MTKFDRFDHFKSFKLMMTEDARFKARPANDDESREQRQRETREMVAAMRRQLTSDEAA